MENNQGRENALMNTALKAKTPINIFAIAMMACASILGGSATFIDSCESLTAFKYAIHAFIAVSGMFFLAMLFCRKGIYNPQELDKVSLEVKSEMGRDRPEIAALHIVAMMAVYGVYQFKVKNPCENPVRKHKKLLLTYLLWNTPANPEKLVKPAEPSACWDEKPSAW